MTDRKKPASKHAAVTLSEDELNEVEGGAAESPVAASRFGISVDGVQTATTPPGNERKSG